MKILLADDHQLFLEGFKLLVAMLDEETEIITVPDASLLRKQIEAHPDTDLMTLDLSMPGLDSSQLLKWMAQQTFLIPVVIVSASEEPRDIQRALDAGASGFIPKTTETQQMLKALQAVLDGNIYVPDEWRRIIKNMQQEQQLFQSLSQRQTSILQLISSGKSNREIAEALHISEHTVKSHLQTIFQILSVSNRMECVRKAEQLGLL